VSFSGLPLTYNSFTDIQLTKPTGIIKVGSTNEMEILVTPKNSIPNNGTIRLTFPVDLVLISSTTCSAVSSEASHTCIVNITSQKIEVTTTAIT